MSRGGLRVGLAVLAALALAIGLPAVSGVQAQGTTGPGDGGTMGQGMMGSDSGGATSQGTMGAGPMGQGAMGDGGMMMGPGMMGAGMMGPGMMEHQMMRHMGMMGPRRGLRGCGTGAQQVPARAISELPRVTIDIYDGLFDPADVTVAPGTVVVWRNRGHMPHSTTSWDRWSDILQPGESCAVWFVTPGTYEFLSIVAADGGKPSGSVTVAGEPIPSGPSGMGMHHPGMSMGPMGPGMPGMGPGMMPGMPMGPASDGGSGSGTGTGSGY